MEPPGSLRGSRLTVRIGAGIRGPLGIQTLTIRSLLREPEVGSPLSCLLNIAALIIRIGLSGV